MAKNQTKNDVTKKPRKSYGQKPYQSKGKKTSASKGAAVKNKKSAPKKSAPQLPLRITPLGGLGEIGKNITLYEYKDEMLLVDCGMSFPDEETPGIDIVIPDFTYVLANADKIKGLFLTHGHEDHIGAIPYLLKNFNVPIYATRLTLGLVEAKLKEHRLLESAKLNVVKPGDIIRLGAFSVELIHVNHSIPDAVGMAIRCPAGLCVHTGDFKIDTTPIDDKVIDISRFAELGREGVLAYLADSTNVERPGYTSSERLVGESFSNLFKKARKNRIIVATFSSNIHRIQQIIDEAVNCGRKVAVSGRSMLNVVNIAAELGYLNVAEGVLIDVEDIKKYTPDKLVIVTTGSQGEPMSALHRIAAGEHRSVEIIPGDMIIISATPIPGNEKLVNKVINELMKRGANVVYEKMYDVHVSGHACQEELKLMLSIIKPKYFIPLHGEQKHLAKHSMLAQSMGMAKENIVVAQNGSVIELSPKAVKIADHVTAGRVLVDGLGVGDVGSIVLRDRLHLSEHGIIIIVLTMDSVTGEVVSGPDVVSRGFVYVKESEELMAEITELSCDILERCYYKNRGDWNSIKLKLRDGVSKFLYERTRRSPMILPIIMEI
ncbi:MAG: ribonuclease J [Acutalibacteraceae bacterium]|nr:ribonuclease J [Acutalibacteraceae bacterium]